MSRRRRRVWLVPLLTVLGLILTGLAAIGVIVMAYYREAYW